MFMNAFMVALLSIHISNSPSLRSHPLLFSFQQFLCCCCFFIKGFFAFQGGWH